MFAEIGSETNWILETFKSFLIQGNLHDVRRLDAVLKQMALEEIEEKIALPDSAKAGNDLHKSIVLPFYQLVKV